MEGSETKVAKIQIANLPNELKSVKLFTSQKLMCLGYRLAF